MRRAATGPAACTTCPPKGEGQSSGQASGRPRPGAPSQAQPRLSAARGAPRPGAPAPLCARTAEASEHGAGWPRAPPAASEGPASPQVATKEPGAQRMVAAAPAED
eukprot:9386256-Alexandrium_andersonii.AAC.1